MANLTHVNPGETVTVYATPDEPKRVSVANAPAGALYYEGVGIGGDAHKWPTSGSVQITQAYTFVGGTVISTEQVGEGNAAIHDRVEPTKQTKDAAKPKKKKGK